MAPACWSTACLQGWDLISAFSGSSTSLTDGIFLGAYCKSLQQPVSKNPLKRTLCFEILLVCNTGDHSGSKVRRGGNLTVKMSSVKGMASCIPASAVFKDFQGRFCTHAYLHKHVNAQTLVHKYICKHTCTCISTIMYMQILPIQTQGHTQIHMQAYKTPYMHVHKHTNRYTCKCKTQTQMHTYAYMHAHTSTYICKYTPKAYMKHMHTHKHVPTNMCV